MARISSVDHYNFTVSEDNKLALSLKRVLPEHPLLAAQLFCAIQACNSARKLDECLDALDGFIKFSDSHSSYSFFELYKEQPVLPFTEHHFIGATIPPIPQGDERDAMVAQRRHLKDLYLNSDEMQRTTLVRVYPAIFAPVETRAKVEKAEGALVVLWGIVSLWMDPPEEDDSSLMPPGNAGALLLG
ncbi:hypothetical protein Lumi_113 [Xylophilus phage Lumi]|nr:hypothetical protein Lumi_113 [Xylophilus phage Lumi]